MSNILTYTLNMNGNINNMLQRVGASANTTTRDVDDLGSSVKSLNKVNLSGFFSSVGKIAGVLGIGAMLGKSIKSGMEQEMRNTSFDVLFGGADNAKKMIDEISGYAAKSPYGKVGLSEATQMMAGFGIAQEKIIPNLKMIGDIAMGDAQKFKSLSLAFSQMSSTGKLTGQDLLQMINAGFNPLEQMAKTTGKSIAVLKDEMSKGVISSEMVTKAFQDATKEGGLYYGMIDKISNTAAGQWATAMGNVSEIMLSLYSHVIQPFLLPALKAVNGLFDRFGGKIQSAMTAASTAISGFMERVMQMIDIKAVLDVVSIAFQEVYGFFQSLVSSIMESNISTYFQAVSDLLSNYIVPLISKLWNFIKDIVIKVVDFVGQSTLLRDIWLGIVNFAKGLVRVVSWVVDKLKWLFDNVVMPILGAIEKAYRLITGRSPSKVEIVTKNPAKEITPPTVPGTENVTASTANSVLFGMGGGTINGAGKETANSIATGGTKTTHITIHLGELVGTVNISKNGFRESAENMRDIVLDEMTRVLSMAQGQVA